MLLALLLSLVACGEQHSQARPAPPFKLPLLTGSGDVSLQDYQGQVVYLTFWASWCIPCRQEMPYLAQLRDRHGEEGFEVLAINVEEDAGAARKFAADYGMDFPVLRDPNRVVSSVYRVPGFPTHYLVDRFGRIRFSGLGFDLNDVRAVSEEVVTLLAESTIEELELE
ncbi:MAG: TlpA disulfide reductase family protein [Halieaceae bacterium]